MNKIFKYAQLEERFFAIVILCSGQIIYSRLITDYIVNLVFISVFMIFFKYSFDSDRKELVVKNNELEQLNKDLTEQTDSLQETNS